MAKFDEKQNGYQHKRAVAGIDSNTKFKWPVDLVKDLLKALSNFKIVIEFQNLEIKGNKGSLLTKFHRSNVDLVAFISLHICHFYSDVSPTLSFFVFSFSALIFPIGCLALLFPYNVSFLLIFSDVDNRQWLKI